MDVLQVLHDIYETVDHDVEEGKRLIVAMAAILVASKDGQGDKLWEEIAIDQAMKDIDQSITEILNEK